MPLSPKRIKFNAHLRSSISVSTFGIEQISCFKPNRMWLATGDNIMEINEDGHLLKELDIYWIHGGCYTLTKAGDLLFKYVGDIYMLPSSGEIRNLHIQAGIKSCIHSSRLNGDIFVSQYGWIKRYNDKGVELQTITVFRYIVKYSSDTCIITENINGDIIVTSYAKEKVVAFRSDGKHKFTYSDLNTWSTFVPSSICTDIFGHILVGNSCLNDPCIHLLDKNGELQSKLLTHQHQDLEFRALCVDDKNNLYVGCYSRINVYTYLTDNSFTEHDTKVIDSEMKT